MTQNVVPNYPNISSPLTLEGQHIAQAWQQLFLRLFNDNIDLQSRVAALEAAQGQVSQDGALSVPPQSQIAVSQ